MDDVKIPPEVAPQAPPAPASEDVFVFPASFAQQRLWFLDKLEPGQNAYNVPLAIRFRGKLQPDVLERSIQELIARHETLRTTLSEDENGNPVQIVTSRQNFSLPTVDLSTSPASLREDEARGKIIEQARAPFDLQHGPLFRASLLRLNADDHILSFIFHHSIVDGWSMSILIREIASVYEALLLDRPVSLPELSLQYGDYATWHQDWLKGERVQTLLTYWKKQLEGAPAVLELPADLTRPAMQSFAGGQESVLLPATLEQSLTELSRKQSATLFMTLLAAFDVLLSRYTGQEDIVVGSPISGRTRAELEGIVGLFVNTLVFRNNLSGNPTFRELLNRVRETTLQAQAHQELPFEKLVEELKPERDLSRNPVIQVFFSFDSVPKNDKNTMGDIALSSFRGAEGLTAKFDIALNAAVTREGMRLGFTYNVDLFHSSTIQRMLSQLTVLLQELATNPDRRLSDLPLLSAAERQQLLVAFNRTVQDYPGHACVHQLFEQQVQRTPHAVAATDNKDRWTYNELNQRANQIARMLRRQGVGPETRVGICLDRSLNMLAAVLGTLKAGAAYIPLDPSYPKDRILFVMQDSGMQVLLTQSSLAPNLPSNVGRIICVDTDKRAIASEESSNPATEVTPRNLAYMIYTSGSTGKPKGVQIEHRSVVNFLASMQREPGFKATDVLLAVTTLSFDIAGLELYLPLIAGAKVVIATREQAIDGTQLIRLMRQHKVTVMQATPATWRVLLDAGWQGDPTLKVLCGGEALPRSLAERLLPLCGELWNMYGPTETTIWSSVYRVTDFNWTAAPIGHPIANTQMYVLDKNAQPALIGVAGELFIGGDGVARGYWNRPELTAQKFIPDPFSQTPGDRLYCTGDLARYLPDGNLQYLSRIDNQVKVRGFRIELGEIESVLARHSSVQQVAVTVREDVPGDQRIVAYIVPSPGTQADPSALRSYLKTFLPDYMVPTAFVVLARLPLTPNGKVDRKALPAPEYSAVVGDRVPPRNDAERIIASVWEKVLGISEVGVTDNFFEIGGHSLLAVRLMSEIQKTTGKVLPLASLFQGATVETLARLLQQECPAPEQIITEVQRGSGKNPFFAIVVPGVNALGYINLARHLGSDEPLYKIQGLGPRLRGRPYTAKEFEDLAAEYIRAMKTVQPTGPYCVGGMCEGARIAFDMARLLEAQHEEVSFLGVFDTWVLENSQIRWLWKINYYSGRIKALGRLTPKEAWEMVSTSVSRFFTGKRVKSLWPDTYWPGEEYVPPKYGGKITLFKLPKQPYFYVDDPLMGWGQRCVGGVEIQLIKSKHLQLLREPYVRELARTLGAHLGRARHDSSHNGNSNDSQNDGELVSVCARTTS